MDSALSKVERAERLVQELRGVLEKKRPFKYFVETNIRTKERRTGARRDATVIGEVLTIVGDIVHNLRSALDHAYWEIVGPLATSPNEEKRVQFPFGRNPIQFENEIKTRMAERVSQRFVDELRRIAPHGGPNGNSILYSIHELNNMDKHKFPVPVGDFKSSSGIEMRRQIPDFPFSV